MANIENDVRVLCMIAAGKNGWILNPDRKKVDAVCAGLARNMKLWGATYCPCVVIKVISEVDRNDFICPCKKAKEQIESDGICRCRLFCKMPVVEK